MTTSAGSDPNYVVCHEGLPVEPFYGDGQVYESGWWAKCGACGAIVKMDFAHGREELAWHHAKPPADG